MRFAFNSIIHSLELCVLDLHNITVCSCVVNKPHEVFFLCWITVVKFLNLNISKSAFRIQHDSYNTTESPGKQCAAVFCLRETLLLTNALRFLLVWIVFINKYCVIMFSLCKYLCFCCRCSPLPLESEQF